MGKAIPNRNTATPPSTDMKSQLATRMASTETDGWFLRKRRIGARFSAAQTKPTNNKETTVIPVKSWTGWKYLRAERSKCKWWVWCEFFIKRGTWDISKIYLYETPFVSLLHLHISCRCRQNTVRVCAFSTLNCTLGSISMCVSHEKWEWVRRSSL